MNGVLLVCKPKNWTSRDVVNKVSKIFGTKKVGHCGTLDPMATGVLVLCLGSYTKLVNDLSSHEKEYIATMQFGIQTDTGDITGKILKEDSKFFSEEEILSGFQKFPFEYVQKVPMYSAVKVHGKKLYQYAREGVEIEAPSRTVFLSSLEILKIEWPFVTFRVVVSKGTYIRSLILDIAKSFSTVATMSDLVRTKSGNFSLEQCYSLEDISIDTPLLSLEDLFSYPKVLMDDSMKKRVLNGNKILLSSSFPRVFLMDGDKAVAIYEKENSEYKYLFRVM